MGSIYMRGGLPEVLAGTATATFQKWEFKTGVTNHLTLENLSTTEMLHVAFWQADADAGRYVEVPPIIGSPGNPLQIPVEAAELYLRAERTTVAFRALGLVRRG
jgi:hypothetical protein